MTTDLRVPPSAVFTYVGGKLHAEDVDLAGVAEAVGTPCYVYSAAAIDGAVRGIDAALAPARHTIAYAVKANGNLSLLSRLANAGIGADIVSGGELARCLRAGFSADRIVFSGVGKTPREIREALDAGVRTLHVESSGELDVVEGVARELGKRAAIALRINPDVDAGTHPYIATGLHGNKFGIEPAEARALVPRILASDHLSLEGVACHIGSMVLSPDPMAEALEMTTRFACWCAEQGAPIRAIDSGGGWPVMYGDEKREAASHAAFGAALVEAFRRGGGDTLDAELVVEPGRAIVGDAGVLLARVLYVKQRSNKRFVIVDAAMTDLIRPALYDAYHAVMPVVETAAADEGALPTDVVGPVCESGDFLALGRALPDLSPGDLLAIRGAGAYGAAMASNYNGRPFAAEVLVEGASHHVIRRRQTIESLWRDEEDPS